ncbi:MAG: phosphatidylserine/phosphatidylglycerophosphate/cardiolipin synthase family protein [Akkermansiaceae bacterium]|nr:phosphatidylserine/phosphatidylglycerophosphate/cardiolipin synthase family protein [Verrucomicrobiales bacterium]
MAAVQEITHNWLCTGDDLFPAMLGAIDAAQTSVCLETYTFSASALADRFRDTLLRAHQRGVRVCVLIDGLGSIGLAASYWEPLRTAGAEVRVFNPVVLHRMSIRNHRKLLVCDDHIAFVGGFNIAPEYEGDGVKCGWCDVGLKISGPLVAQLAVSFDEMFGRADFRHKRFMRLRRFNAKRSVTWRAEQILLSGPGRGRSPITLALLRDLARAKDVKIAMAYFLPTWRLRRALMNIVRQGGRVQLILPGKSDVAVSQLAARSLYRRLLKAGVEICEYQPQILHAKMIIADDIVYIGSANLDQRSLLINYELMIRFQNAALAKQAREVFSGNLENSVPITLEDWRRSRTLWGRIKQRWAYFLLVRIDPYVARWQWRSLPD